MPVIETGKRPKRTQQEISFLLRTFYYLLSKPKNPNETRFLRQTLGEILESKRSFARTLHLIKSNSD